MNNPARESGFFRRVFWEELTEDELENPNFETVLKVVWRSIRKFFPRGKATPPAAPIRMGQVIFTSFILLMLWGTHGNLELLGLFWPAWRPPGSAAPRPVLLPGIPWGNELISFWLGAFLLVVLPIFLITFGFKQRLSFYGLGLPPRGRRLLAIWTFFALTLVTAPAIWFASKNADMREIYPFFKSFTGTGQFMLYELTYLPFFIAIEFIFRGYLLFGLADLRFEDVRREAGAFRVVHFHRYAGYAILIQMLSYTAWHLGKPLPELWGTLVWGLAAGAMAYAVRSIWPVVLSHWLMNVFLDGLITGIP